MPDPTSPFVKDQPLEKQVEHWKAMSSLSLFFGMAIGGAAVGLYLSFGFAPPEPPKFAVVVPPAPQSPTSSRVAQYETPDHRIWWTFRYGNQVIRVPANCKE